MITFFPKLQIDIIHSFNISNSLRSFNQLRSQVNNLKSNVLHHVSNGKSSVSIDYLHSTHCAITLRVSGQQAAGMHSLVSFQCLAGSLMNHSSVQILEPIMVKTEYCAFGPQQYNGKHSTTPFSDLFDIQHFNDVSESLQRPPIVLRKHFLATAPKNVILVYIKQTPQTSSNDKQRINVVWSADSKGHPKDICYKDSKLKPLLNLKFCVIKVIQVTFSGQISVKNLRQFLYKNRSQENMTIVFSEWRHYWYKSNVDFGQLLRPSPKLLSDVEYYERTFLNSSNNVVVMFRTEHLLRFLEQQSNQNARKEWTLEKCLLKAVQVTQAIQGYGQPMVTLDLGKYGSAVWGTVPQDIQKLTANTVSILSPLFGNKSTSFEEWEQSFPQATRGQENSAYIAALQRTLASRARCLILVGGGTFQRMSLEDYINNHPNEEEQCVNILCTLRNYKVGRYITSFDG